MRVEISGAVRQQSLPEKMQRHRREHGLVSVQDIEQLQS
jgi:hypothetical protein